MRAAVSAAFIVPPTDARDDSCVVAGDLRNTVGEARRRLN